MTLLLHPRAASEPPLPIVTRNKTAVIDLVRTKAPKTIKRDARWWAAWLEANW